MVLDEGRFTIFDGALGTMLQQAGMAPGCRPEAMLYSSPQVLTDIHRAYIEAGADIVAANTFGANAKKLADSGYEVADVIARAVACAKEAARGTAARVALDVGPLGEMMAPGGTLSFDEAYEVFAEAAAAGEQAGADLVLIETMTDLLEVKAAVLAAREHTKLPVLASMTFEPAGRTFAGVPVAAMAAVLPGLGVSGLGINCSLAPEHIMPMAAELARLSSVPVFIMPNAGLPDPATGAYTLSPEAFCRQMEPCFASGVCAVGGCCGTTPEEIRLLAAAFGGKAPVPRPFVSKSVLASGVRAVEIDRVLPIGERINPTGKKQLQTALAAGDLGYVQTLAVEQEAAGASFLDVNVGAPGVDEVKLLPLAVQAVQAVCGLPLVLDSANPAALAAALRVYNGKPLINSTSGEAAKMAAVLPLAAKYGAAVLGLVVDDDGIPKTAEARFAVAEKIVAAAAEHGIPKEDVFIDCLTLAASAGEAAATESVRAVALVKECLGCRTVLGVSNVSFGLPARTLVNAQFMVMALAAGLDMPIINPTVPEMMDAVRAYEMLSGADVDAKLFLARFADAAEPAQAQARVPAPQNTEDALRHAIENGLKEDAARYAKLLLDGGADGMDLLNGCMMPALDAVGEKFEAKTMFLPQLLAAAGAAEAAFAEVKARYRLSGEDAKPVVVATVQGDVHDIGKNIAKALLENYGFAVVDLGRDVPPERVVEAVKQSGARVAGLSALMTTTLPAMEATIAALHAEMPGVKVMCGGAVLTREYAEKIGADFYVDTATASVEAAKAVYAG